MIIDSSAMVAILRAEPDAARLYGALSADRSPAMSVANYLETSIVIDSYRDAVLSRQLDSLVAEHEMVLRPVTADQARIARQAYRDFGKSSGHPAQLNFGDCFAYALAIDTDEPLLFKGDDFGHTGVRVAL